LVYNLDYHKKMVKKIILVEDDSAIIDIYQTMIKKAGFDVEVISLGQEVLKRVKEVVAGEKPRPDMMLLDLILPDMNGIEILAEIRKNEATKSIKVFILTNQEESGVATSDSVKPDKFIVKANMTPTQLIEVIKQELA